MNVPILEPDAKKDRLKILVDYFTINRNNHTFYAFKTSDSNYYSCDVIGDRAYILFMLKYLNMHNIYLLYSTLCIPDLNSRKNALLGRLFGDD